MDQTKEYASFWLRAFAILLDGLIWSLGFFALVYVISISYAQDVFELAPALLWLVLYLIVVGLVRVFVNAYLTCRFGGGLGKLLFGLRVEHADSTNLTFRRAFFREYVAKIASNSLFGVGYYWIFKTEKKQAWHDMLSDTYVVKTRAGIISGLPTLLIVLSAILVLAYLSVVSFSKNKETGVQIVKLFESIKKDDTSKPQLLPN